MTLITHALRLRRPARSRWKYLLGGAGLQGLRSRGSQRACMLLQAPPHCSCSPLLECMNTAACEARSERPRRRPSEGVWGPGEGQGSRYSAAEGALFVRRRKRASSAARVRLGHSYEVRSLLTVVAHGLE